MERINLKIDSKKKDEITQYVEENNEYSSMSHFIRVAANKEMSDEEEDSQQVPPRVSQTLNQITQELEEIRSGISGITIQLESEDVDIQALAQEVYETIPRAPATNSAEIASTGRSLNELDNQHAHSVLQNSDKPSTITGIAQHLNADKKDIQDSIHHLKSNFLPILELVDDEGNKHILKQEERR